MSEIPSNAVTWLTILPAIIATVGIPLLTLIVTSLVTKGVAKTAAKSQEQQLRLAHQLKLADFRQAWIDGLRQDFAIYTALMWDEETNAGVDSKVERIKAQARILMRLNPDDPDYNAVLASLAKPVASKAEGRKALFQVAQPVLKREWDRLKDDLAMVEESKA